MCAIVVQEYIANMQQKYIFLFTTFGNEINTY